jgi:hypothetical protein|tara:strand:- start:929 stop:1090 length:162 start_codon:yes stop_codon:yes gene_type:complete
LYREDRGWGFDSEGKNGVDGEPVKNLEQRVKELEDKLLVLSDTTDIDTREGAQ